MITWVLGGTAVGKKTFIRNMPELGEPAWMDDGEIPSESLWARDGKHNLLVRWQWGRETTISRIAGMVPILKQRFYLLISDAEVQTLRAEQREGEKRWSLEDLQAEAKTVRWLAIGIASDYGVPLTVVDVSSDDTETWQKSCSFSLKMERI